MGSWKRYRVTELEGREGATVSEDGNYSPPFETPIIVLSSLSPTLSTPITIADFQGTPRNARATHRTSTYYDTSFQCRIESSPSRN